MSADKTATTTTTTGSARTSVIADTYADSLRLLVATSVMTEVDGVSFAGAVMATPAGKESLAGEGFTEDTLGQVGSNDLVLAVRAADDDRAEAALAAGAQAVFADAPADTGGGIDASAPPRSIAAATKVADPNVAIISVSGDYAALEAHHALTAGLHVLLFSDNVSLEEEVELKRRATNLGLLVMGPGAGTAVISGVGLGFANRVRRGPVGVIAAAGTGAQEVSALLDRWGVGVSHVIGVGGRDLSEEVEGRMAKAAVRALRQDPATQAILIVSKPPNERVAREVLAECGSTPAVATFLGLTHLDSDGAKDDRAHNDGGSEHRASDDVAVQLARTLEDGAVAAARLVGGDLEATTTGLREKVEGAIASLGDDRRTVRGYYSGGTLCYEAQLIVGDLLGDVYSNEPLVAQNLVAQGTAPAPAGSHVLLDLGAEEYTVGRPHPMIDPSTRIEMLRTQARDPEVAAVLLDVVLGFGAHDDPAAVLAPVLQEVMADGGPQVVAYVLGSASDPQGYQSQRAALERVGCIVTETAARAAYAAAAIASRRPELAEHK